MGEGIAGKVVQLGEAVLVEDIATDPRFAQARAIPSTAPAPSCACRCGSRTASSAWSTWPRARRPPPTPAFSPTDLQFLNTLMTHIAYAVDNARLLQEAQLSANRLRRAMEDLRTTQTRIVEGETLRAVGQMASGMAHHVNNLLAVISGRVQLLLGRVIQPEVRRPLEIVQQATFDAADVVRRVLGFTALQPVASGAPVNLNDIVREVVELSRPRWRDEAQIRSVALDVVLDLGEVPPVTGDASALREVVMNLLFNAIDAMQQSGTIRVTTWAVDDWVHCSVTDTGVGMTDEVRSRAIEPFFTTKGPRGTGLGLSVSHSVMQRHGGELSLRPNEGGGTVVTLRLPRRSPPTPATAEPTPTRRRPCASRGRRRADRARGARRHAGRGRPHGAPGAQRPRGPGPTGRGRQVDVVITDLGMPEMTGWDVARAVRSGGLACRSASSPAGRWRSR